MSQKVDYETANEVREIFLLFLRKYELMTEEERACITRYLLWLTEPVMLSVLPG